MPKTSYKLLLGRSWLHKHRIVAFTIHQCLKYYRLGETKINSNARPFTKIEFHFTDTRFIEEDDIPKETMLSIITSMGKVSTKNALQMPKEDTPKQQLKMEQSELGDTPSSIKQADKKVVTSKGSAPIVLRYFTKSRRKDGESPFSECSILKSTTNTDNQHNKVNWAFLREMA